MASTSSSSSSWPYATARKYDVFMSFKGETRHNFTSHLHAALDQASLKVFRDDKQLEKGDEIAPSLIQAIKDSNISIVVFSENYASSRWCLDELTQITQYRKEEGQYVIPIFYKVDPTHVRNQIGAYEKAFEEHERKHGHDRVSRWKAALYEVGNLSGRHCETSTDESELIQEIVIDVITKLERIYKCQGTLKDAVGIDEMIEPIEELLEKSHKVGIWGMGGIGKTTLAKALFVKLSYQYDNCCFLENVREKMEKNGSEHVCNSLVLELLRKDMPYNPTNALEYKACIARRLFSKKALVVLDDVDSCKQLEDLQDNICNFLGVGSKVIITTRDMQLLRSNCYEIYEAKGLSYENSLRLFISKAFQSDDVEKGHEHLTNGFIDYTQHNPLALKILGSLVCSLNKKAWGDLLRKVRGGNPNDEIQKVLRLSYDRLDYKEKQIFLDIACFLKGESEEFVEELLGSYDFYPTIGMQTLKDKALIFTTCGKVDMHDLIQEMGYQIVREENIKEPGKRSRLWDPCEISDVLKNCEGEKEVEGILLLDRFKMTPSDLTAKTFSKMTRLRYLKIYSSWGPSLNVCMTSTPTDLESISNRIRYFYWEGYPWKSLPLRFCTEHLLELNLSGSLVETLWEGVQDLMNLRRLKLQGCRFLRELPDFSKACRLERVNLGGCDSLCDVPASLLSHDSLISLDARYCYNLESLKCRIHLKSLKELDLCCCENLKEFSVSSEELTSLDLSGTKIEELSPSIGRCSKLRTLNLLRTKLKNLPMKALSCLTFLEELHVSLVKIDNDNLSKLFDGLRSLQSLSLVKFWNLTKLPNNALHSLPCLRELTATDCISFGIVSTSTISSKSANYGEKIFSFTECLKLDLGAIEEQAKWLLEKAVHEKEYVTVYYPGIKIPEWFGNNRTQNDSAIVRLFLSSHTLVGLVFCVIAPEEKICYEYLGIAFSIEEEEMTDKVVEILEFGDFRPGNVLLRSYPEVSEMILKKFEGNRGDHEATNCNPNIFLQFRFYRDNSSYHPAKMGGVYPIYAFQNFGPVYSNPRKRKAIMI